MNESIIYKKLKNYFNPCILKVSNHSSKHIGHQGSPNTGNSHFFVEIMSNQLKNIPRVNAQRKIYEVLDKEMKEFIHAIEIKIID